MDETKNLQRASEESTKKLYELEEFFMKLKQITGKGTMCSAVHMCILVCKEYVIFLVQRLPLSLCEHITYTRIPYTYTLYI